MYVLPPLLVYISEVPENWNGTNKGNSLFTKMLHNNQIETLQLTKLIDSNVSSYLLSLLIIKKSTVQRLNRIGWGISKVFQQTTKTGSWLAESQLNHINTSFLHGLDDEVKRISFKMRNSSTGPCPWRRVDWCTATLHPKVRGTQSHESWATERTLCSASF